MSLTDDLRQVAVVHRRDGTVAYKASADRLTPVTTSDFAAPAASTTTRS